MSSVPVYQPGGTLKQPTFFPIAGSFCHQPIFLGQFLIQQLGQKLGIFFFLNSVFGEIQLS